MGRLEWLRRHRFLEADAILGEKMESDIELLMYQHNEKSHEILIENESTSFAKASFVVFTKHQVREPPGSFKTTVSDVFTRKQFYPNSNGPGDMLHHTPWNAVVERLQVKQLKDPRMQFASVIICGMFQASLPPS